MKRKAVGGFYWTLPVPWAGFTALPSDIEGAAAASRTIRYQRALIRAHAAAQGYDLIHEQAFLEIDPDRGSAVIVEALEKAAAICRKDDAALLVVNFSGVRQWRGHDPLEDWLQRFDHALPIEAAPIMVDGEMFDPHAHFAQWRAGQRAWSEGKHERAEQALRRAQELRANGMKNPAIAHYLNEEGLRSLSGRPWTAESLRKFLASSV